MKVNSITTGIIWSLVLLGGVMLQGCRKETGPQEQRYQEFITTKAVVSSDDAEHQGTSLEPILNHGKPFRIGIIESGVWTGFGLYFDAVIDALTNYGWGDADVYASLTEEERATIPDLIRALKEKQWSAYIEFPEDAYRRLTLETRQQDTEDVGLRDDLDMIFGLGTWAGQDLKALPSSFTTPCVIMAVSKPLESGILASPDDSGMDHITGRVEVDRFKRQAQLFHDIIEFKTLGVVYAGEDPTAAQYAAIPDIKELQAEINQEHGASFSLTMGTDVPASGDMERINRKFIENVEGIIDSIDAFYLTLQNGVNADTLPGLVELFTTHKVPTFYMGGSNFVRKGVLLSIATNWTPIGVFNAEKVILILKGATPRSLNQVFQAEPRIAINLETARIIEYDPPVDVLAIADEIYNTIEP